MPWVTIVIDWMRDFEYTCNPMQERFWVCDPIPLSLTLLHQNMRDPPSWDLAVVKFVFQNVLYSLGWNVKCFNYILNDKFMHLYLSWALHKWSASKFVLIFILLLMPCTPEFSPEKWLNHLKTVHADGADVRLATYKPAYTSNCSLLRTTQILMYN